MTHAFTSSSRHVSTLLGLALLTACGDDTANGNSAGTLDTGTDSETDDTGGETTSDATQTDGTAGDSTDGATDDTTDSGPGTSTDDEGTDTETTGSVDPEGTLDHIGGHPGSAVVVGSIAYVGIGPRITVWDLDADGGPAQIGRSDAQPGLVSALAIRGDRMYAAIRNDLSGTVEIFDVSTPRAPARLSSLDYTDSLATNPTDLSIDGNVLFVSDTEVGIVSLDLTNADDPQAIETLPLYGVHGLDADGGRVRYIDGGFIGTSVGTLAHTDGAMTMVGASPVAESVDVAFSGELTLTIGGFGFQAFDLSDPSAAISVYGDESLVGHGIAATDTAVYTLADAGLATFALDGTTVTPSSTTDANTQRTTTSALAGTTLLGLTERGWGTVFDLTAPLDPVAGPTFELPVGADAVGAAMGDGVLAVADFYTGLRLLDPATLESLGRYELDGELPAAEAVAIQGSLAYLADWGSGLHVIDISDPSAPESIGFVATGGYASSVAVSGNYAYVGESTDGGSLRIVDVSDATKPSVVGSLSTSKVRDLVVVGNLVYLADEELVEAGGLRIVDVSEPTDPVLLGHYDGCSHALDVAVEGRLAYLACANTNTVHVVDVSNPEAMEAELIIEVEAPGVMSLALLPDRLWVGHASGLTAYDNSDPGVPSVLESYPMAYAARRVIQLGDDDVLATAGLAGLYEVTFR